MSNSTPTKAEYATNDIKGENTALFITLRRLLRPLARLCLANGITFATAEEFLKRAFVHEAKAIQSEAPEHGMVSRISTISGLNRREVTRLTKLETPERITKQPLASEILARWTTDPAWRDLDGNPLQIKRLGAAPSFETLAQSITRDVHPRSLLDELIRLDHVSHDENLDLVAVTRGNFVPKSDIQQMLNFLGDNVGDHLNAAITNVLDDGKSHLEQAIFADELSKESLEALQPIVMTHWNDLHGKMAPALTALIEADKIAGRTQDQRFRIGLYTFTDATTDSATSQKSQTARRFRKSASKEETTQ
jgi:hypothetical protein